MPPSKQKTNSATEIPIVHQPDAQLPWMHNCIVLDGVKDEPSAPFTFVMRLKTVGLGVFLLIK